MELDIFKEKWAEQDRKLDSAIRLNRRLLIATELNRGLSPLRLFAFFTGTGGFLGLIALGILGRFILCALDRTALCASGRGVTCLGHCRRRGVDPADGDGASDRLRQAGRIDSEAN